MKKRKSKQPWQAGDVFLISTQDGRHLVGQILAHEPRAMNSASCVFFDWSVENAAEVEKAGKLPVERIFSTLLVTRDHLDDSIWKVIANRPICLSQEMFPYEKLRAGGFVGAKITGTAIVRAFLNAFRGLIPWDDWHDPNYLDSLLISVEKKPKGLIYKRKPEGSR
jgi:hypothetical protein